MLLSVLDWLVLGALWWLIKTRKRVLFALLGHRARLHLVTGALLEGLDSSTFLRLLGFCFGLAGTDAHLNFNKK